MIRALRERQRRIDRAIEALEEMAAGPLRRKRRGAPPRTDSGDTPQTG